MSIVCETLPACRAGSQNACPVSCGRGGAYKCRHCSRRVAPIYGTARVRWGRVPGRCQCKAQNQKPQGGFPFLAAFDDSIIAFVYMNFYGYFFGFSVANRKPIRKVTIVFPKSSAVFIISLVLPPKFITAVSKITKKANAPKHQHKRTKALSFRFISCCAFLACISLSNCSTVWGDNLSVSGDLLQLWMGGISCSVVGETTTGSSVTEFCCCSCVEVKLGNVFLPDIVNI